MGKHVAEKLTASKIDRLTEPGRYSDGKGLYLQVARSEGRSKSWIFQFAIGGKVRQMGLGPYPGVAANMAREKAKAARLLLDEGLNPIDAKKAAKDSKLAALRAVAAETAKLTTFAECAYMYLAQNEPTWTNPKHRAQWRSTLENYVLPWIGHLPVGDVDQPIVLKILQPIWRDKTETAGRIRGRIEKILDFARVNGFRSGENPARWQGNLQHALPNPSVVHRVRHHKALHYAKLPAFMAELRARTGVSARALEFTILTATRTGAVIGAPWDEFDLGKKIWTVSPERAGTKIKPGSDGRRVPLSERAMEILEGLHREEGSQFVFIGGKAGKPLSNMAMLQLLRDMQPGFTTHGFRSSFKDWSAEKTNYPAMVSEAALFHTVADKVEAAYRRGDLFEKRQSLMRDWARYCASNPSDNRNNVTPLRRTENVG